MAKTYSCVLVGVEVVSVEIETVVGNGFSGLNILGISTDVARDMRERVRSALESIGIFIPAKRVTVNITPSDKTKESRTALAQLDFAVAASILSALYEDKLNCADQHKVEYFAGELTLKGDLKEINNPLIYKAILLSQTENITLNFPLPNRLRDAIFSEKCVLYYKNLAEWWQCQITTQSACETSKQQAVSLMQKPQADLLPFKENEFQFTVQQVVLSLLKNPKAAVAILIAALGKHHILLAGEPGIGKTFSLQKIQLLLPPLTENEAFEIQLIHSNLAQVQRPFRSPHHSASSAAMIGGSALKPGEVSLAHHGILFLDELTEFSSSSLEALREPLDAGNVFISRANGFIRYPARFQLCATTNPCSCGFLFSKFRACRCHPKEIRKYLQKLSGPLLDRFCLQVWLTPPDSLDNLDIFAKHLSSLQHKNNIEKFIKNFIYQLLHNSNENYDQLKEEISLILTSYPAVQVLSLRGQDKLLHLIYSFKKIFPEYEVNAEFIENVLSYRILDKMFLQKNLF